MTKSYQCSFCTYITTRLYNFERHNKSMHNTNDDNQQTYSYKGHHVTFQCPYCQYATKRVYNFKRHCKGIHKKIIDPYYTNMESSENMHLQSLDNSCCEERKELRKPIVITSTGSSFVVK